MHALPASGSGLPEWALRAYEWCDELIFESDPPTILSQLRSTTGHPLRRRITPHAWAVLEGLWPVSGPIPPLESVQIWAALIFGSMLACRTTEGVEPIFLKWAANHSKGVHFLESAEELADALDSAPIEEVVKSIELLASDLSAPQRSIEAMYRAWLKQDLSALYEIAERSPAFQFPGVRRAALQRRNQAWAPILTNRMSTSKRTLIAVGALHLYGPENLFTWIEPHAKPIK